VRKEVAEFYQHKMHTGKPSKACSGSDVSRQRWGEASPSCSQNKKAEGVRSILEMEKSGFF